MMLFNRNIKKIHSVIPLAFLISLLVCSGINAGLLDYRDSNEIILIIGETKPLSVNNPRQVKISNPDFLDVVGAGRKELLLDGKAEGETVLTVVDIYGSHKYVVKIFSEDLVKVKERVDFLLQAAGFGDLTTRIADKERKIFITGRVAAFEKDVFTERIAPIQDKIINLIQYEAPLSVEIDVEILEIEKSALDNLGISWNKSILFEEGGVADGVVGDAAYDLLDPKMFFRIMKDWRTGTFSATLNFLKQNNKARTLSRPKLVCLSGKEAKLNVGGEIPIISGSTSSTTSAGTTTDYEIELKEIGIILTIMPTVRENDEIQIALSTEIIEIDTTTQLTLSEGVTTPGFTTRIAETELTVLNGQTVFLAGLIKSKRTDNRDQIQGLGSIPFLGALFRNKDIQQRDTEIVITLTPTIVRNVPKRKLSPVAKVNIPTESKDAYLERVMNSVRKSLAKEDDPLLKYSNLVQRIINSNLKYPKELRDKNIEGTVKLSLQLQSNGDLLGVVIMRSSGNGILDEVAEITVKRLSPFPAFPSEVKVKELWLDIPIVYKIGSSF